MIIESVILFLFLIVYIYYYLNIKEYYRIARLNFKLPRVSRIPLVGLAFQIARLKESEILEFFRNGIGTERIVGDLLLGKSTVALTQPEDIEKLMNSSLHITKGINYNSLMMWLNEGLLTNRGDKWRGRRKLLTPTFHFRILEDCLPIMHRNANNLLKKLLNAGSKPISIQSYVSKCTLDIICETAMGISLDEEDECAKQYVHDIKRISELIMRRELCPWLRSSIIFTLSSTGREFYQTRNRLYNFTNKVIAERKNIFLESMKEKTGNICDQYDKELTGKKRMVFLDCLLSVEYNNPGTLSDSDIREEVDTFIFEGHDTTSTAILFGIYSLGLHKHVQDKAVQELQNIFGSSDRPPSLKDLQEMTYLECVIKETLRLYPSVPMITRELTHDLHLDGDIIVPATTDVFILPYLLHRDSRIYDEPEKFDPDRFQVNNSKERHPFAFIPFSAGPRNCIGQKFAMLELKTIMSSILRQSEIESFTKTENLDLAPLLILRALNPILVAIKPRQSLNESVIH